MLVRTWRKGKLYTPLVGMQTGAVIVENDMALYIMEFYSAIKNNKILPFVTTWMDLEATMLSKLSQTE